MLLDPGIRREVDKKVRRIQNTIAVGCVPHSIRPPTNTIAICGGITNGVPPVGGSTLRYVGECSKPASVRAVPEHSVSAVVMSVVAEWFQAIVVTREPAC